MRYERLRRIADIRISNVDKKTIEGQIPVQLCNYTDVYYNERISAGMDFMQSTATPEQCNAFQLTAGDVLLTKDSETANDIGVAAVVIESAPRLLCGYHLAMIRPRPGVDGRYLRFALAMSPVRGDMASQATGITRYGLRSGAIGNLTVPIHPLDAQRAIADYLDRETNHIDALIDQKQRLSTLVRERWEATLETEIRRLDRAYGNEPLKHACREVLVGIVITPSAWYAEAGIPAIRGLNVRPGMLSLIDLVYITPEGDALHAKSRLRRGDVVIVRTGQAGAAAVVPAELEGSNCIDLVIIRLGPRLDSHYVELVLNSDWMQKHVEEFTVGTIQGHFNVAAAKNVPIPIPGRREQESVVKKLGGLRIHRDAASSVLARQLDLLREKRQALITAAVTGQIDLPSAA
jgi:type I restriction enzyme S subunit